MESAERQQLDTIKGQILRALSHPEGEEGLYLSNLQFVHESEERPAVQGDQLHVLDALKELISEGRVVTDESGESVVFKLASRRR